MSTGSWSFAAEGWLLVKTASNRMSENQSSPRRDSPTDLTPLELMGAISLRLLHDLANHLAVISGNAQFAQMIADDPERVEKALNSIVTAGDRAGEMLGKCAEFRRALTADEPRVEANVFLERVVRWAESEAGWDPEIFSDVDGYVSMSPEWAIMGFQHAATEAGVSGMRIECRQTSYAEVPERPGRKMRGARPERVIEIIGLHAAASPIVFEAVKADFSRFELLAAFEMIHGAGGWMESATVSPGMQGVFIYLPVLSEQDSIPGD
jgi:hypothetical protein